MLIIKKTRDKFCKGVEKRECLCIISWNVNWCGCYLSFIAKIPKIKIELPYDSAMLLLSTYPKEIEANVSKSYPVPFCSIAALFVVANIWKQPKHPLMDEWKKKIWYLYIMKYYYLALEKKKSCHL